MLKLLQLPIISTKLKPSLISYFLENMPVGEAKPLQGIISLIFRTKGKIPIKSYMKRHSGTCIKTLVQTHKKTCLVKQLPETLI